MNPTALRFSVGAVLLLVLSVAVMRWQTDREAQIVEIERPGIGPIQTVPPFVPAGERLTGRVLDAGSPVGGAVVEWWARKGTGTVVLARVRTGPDGRFTITDAARLDRIGPSALVAILDGRVLTFAERREVGAGTDVVLERSRTVTLRVPFRDSRNRPLVDLPVRVRVEMEAVAWLDWDRPGARFRTGPDGVLEMRGLPAGRYVTVSVTDPTYAPAPSLERVALRGQAVREVPRTKLDRAGSVAGSVRLPDGRPAAGWRLRLNRFAEYLQTTWATVGKDGSYRLPRLRPGYYVVQVVDPADRRTNLAVAGVRELHVGEGDAIRLPEFRLQPGATLTGRVRVAASGLPLEGVRVFAAGATGSGPPPDERSLRFVAETLSAKDGTFTLNVLPGRVLLGGNYIAGDAVLSNRFRVLARPSDLVVAPGQRHTIALLYGRSDLMR